MAIGDKTVRVRLTLDHGAYDKGAMQAAAATSKLGRDIDGVESKSKGLETSTKGATGAIKGLGVAAGVAVGAGLVTFMTDAVQAAGDLEQSIGGVDAVFKDSADTIHAFGKDSADAVGLSTNEFNQLITVTGAMLKNKGLEDFTQKSIDLVKVGADLAAQFGGSTADAVGALNAAMRGESDPIERYGISLNEAAVNAELAAKGLDKLEGAALDQAKAQARVDIITRQSADAMGAFGREADTLQGQQQRLNAEWEDAKASLGGALLPALTDVMSMLRGGVDIVVASAAAFEKIPGPVKAAVGGLIALHVLKGPLGGFLSGTITQVKTLGTTLKTGGIVGGAKAAGSALMGAFGGPLGIAVGIGAAALTFWMQEAQKTEGVADSLRQTIDKTSGAFTGQSKATIAEALLGDLSAEDIKRVESLGFSFEDLATAALEGGPAFDTMRDKIFKMSKEIYEARGLTDGGGQALEGLGRSFVRAGEAAERAKVIGEVADKIEDTGGEAKDAAPKVDVLADKTTELKTAAQEAADKQNELAQAILDVSGAAIEADAAEAEFKQTLMDAKTASEDLAGGVNKARTEFNLMTEAGQEKSQIMRDLATDAEDYAKALLNDGESIDSVKKKMGTLREQFIDAATDMGLSEQAAVDMADKYGVTEGKVDDLKTAMDKIPKKVVSELKAETTQAKKDIQALKDQIALLKGKTIEIKVKTGTIRATGQSSTGGFGRGFLEGNFASGGHVTGPGTKTSDSIPAYLSNGEYVIKAAAVDKYGKHFFDGLNTMKFADGGFVSRMATSPAIDYERLAGALSGGGSGLTVNVTGGDPHRAAREVIDAWQWEVAR